MNQHESATIRRIAERAHKHFSEAAVSDFALDIMATHTGGCPLKLRELADAPDADFLHDICGINRHLNRDTFKLENCFVPRYAK